MKAINDYMVVTPLKEVPKSGDFALSGDAAENMRHRRGELISVSKLAEGEGLKVGNIVHYDKAPSFTILIDGKEHTVIRLRDVVLVE